MNDNAHLERKLPAYAGWRSAMQGRGSNTVPTSNSSFDCCYETPGEASCINDGGCCGYFGGDWRCKVTGREWVRCRFIEENHAKIAAAHISMP